MAVDLQSLSLKQYPDPALRAKARPIETIDEEVRQVARRMIQIMREAGGVGLAGPQVGLAWRIFVANPTAEEGQDRVYINPELSDPSPQTEPREEGCLSLPGIHAQITRPVAIHIRALDEQGQAFAERGEGMAARVWQHETDHLDGVLIVDRMPMIDRQANKRALRELERG